MHVGQSRLREQATITRVDRGVYHLGHLWVQVRDTGMMQESQVGVPAALRKIVHVKHHSLFRVRMGDSYERARQGRILPQMMIVNPPDALLPAPPLEQRRFDPSRASTSQPSATCSGDT